MRQMQKKKKKKPQKINDNKLNEPQSWPQKLAQVHRDRDKYIESEGEGGKWTQSMGLLSIVAEAIQIAATTETASDIHWNRCG